MPAAAIVVLTSAFAMIMPDVAETLFRSIQSTVVNAFSWYYVLITVIFVVFVLCIGFGRFGDIRLGKDDDEPEFSLGAWFSLLFAAGMGIGLVFYGVAEPLSHYVTPRPGVSGEPGQLAQSALVQTYLHWGVHAWAIYVVVGLGLAYAIHRRGRSVSIRWALEPLLGRHVRGAWGNVIDCVALSGTIFGVATSLGLGVSQISAGLDAAGLAEPSLRLQLLLIVVITVVVLFSVLSGVGRGMKWLSSTNLIVAAALLVFVLLVGSTQYILREWVQSIGAYIQEFIGMSFTVSAFQGTLGEAWQAQWTSFYWGWWISWAPFVGIFIARVSRGRTVRQFVAGVLIVPTLIGILWFSVLGGSALYLEIRNPGSMLLPDGTVDMEGALFQFMDHLPGTPLLVAGAIMLIGVFFVTSSDSGALVMGMIATGGNQEPPTWVRIFFAVTSALLAAALLVAGGLTALQTAAILIALPFSVVMLLMCWATFLAFQRENRAYERAQRAQLMDQIGVYYGLEVERHDDDEIHLPEWLRRVSGATGDQSRE
jgi:choline/glycine/proline betaine transport protein